MRKLKSHHLSDAPFSLEQAEKAVHMANEAMAQAYAPYSKFHVGAAILTAGGDIFTGCNVETANYDGTHAEEAALAAMVVAGKRDPVLCVCLGSLKPEEDRAACPPCGKCRQVLMEFSSLSGHEIWIFDAWGEFRGEPNWYNKLSDLLPKHFGPADIGVDLAKYRR